MIKNIVLVHGAFADGSCYAELIRYLQEAGINAIERAKLANFACSRRLDA
ncbi:hypothetical protein [Campylobacter concisus]